jgi:hypothetical protein
MQSAKYLVSEELFSLAYPSAFARLHGGLFFARENDMGL